MTNNCTIKVYKDGFIASRPWSADVIWDDGKIWKGWMHGFRTRKSVLQNIEAAIPTGINAKVEA